MIYCDMILFHPIVIHTFPSVILWNQAPAHDQPTSKRREERIKNRIERFPPYVPAAYMQFPVFLHSEGRKTGKSTLPPMKAAVKMQLLVFLLSERRKTGKSSLPPMRAAVKLKFASLFPSEWRKPGRCEFTAHASSGDAV